MIEPDDYAVAICHEVGELPAVTAKGRGAIAEQIRAVAALHGIPVEADADLVGLLRQLDVGSPIPTAAFAAVAEILAHLYRANAAAQEPRGRAGLR